MTAGVLLLEVLSAWQRLVTIKFAALVLGMCYHFDDLSERREGEVSTLEHSLMVDNHWWLV